tara:strand:- start:276 stop:467 length:192 start_codon:yes stop_codon:yes gene_type:complete
MLNLIVYAENNSTAEMIGVMSETVYDAVYPELEKWAKENGFDRITEAVIENEFQFTKQLGDIK